MPALVFLFSFARSRFGPQPELDHGIGVPNSSSPLVFPPSIDAGPVERGDTKEVRLTLVNKGEGRVTIANFRRIPACACSSVERITENTRIPADTVELGPGQRADLAQRIVAVSPVGTIATHYLDFDVYDRSNSKGRIEVRLGPVTGIEVEPATLLVGDQRIRSVAHHQIRVYSTGIRTHSVARVISSDPDRVRLQWRPVVANDAAISDGTVRALVGQVDVEISSNCPARINCLATVYFDDPGKSPQSVPIIGRFVPPVTVIPERLVLPRQSDSGPIYSTNCVFRSVQGLPLDLTMASTVPGFSAQIAAQGAPSSVRLVTLSYDPRQSAPQSEKREFKLKFLAPLGDEQHTVTLPVMVLQGGDP